MQNHPKSRIRIILRYDPAFFVCALFLCVHYNYSQVSTDSRRAGLVVGRAAG